jgi:hypothetical protein
LIQVDIIPLNYKKEAGMLGINDPQVWSAYLLCILSAVFCLIYGVNNWNKGDEAVRPEDKKWVDDQKKAQDEL